MIDVDVMRSPQFQANVEGAKEAVVNVAHERVALYAEILATLAKTNVLRLRNPDRALPSVLADSIHLEQEQPGEIKVVADAPYALAVEFGTSRTVAQPFMTPAVMDVLNL